MNQSRRLRPSSVVLLMVSALAMLVTLMPTSAAAPPAKDDLKWHNCYGKLQEQVWPDEFAEFFGGPIRFECATVPVPLDYDGSEGGTIQVGMVRIPARDQANKIGSLFSNPGGPGGSGIEFTLFAGATAFSPEIRDRFDIVGFDPRGILLSTAARCYGNYRQAGDAFQFAPPPAPGDEVGTWLDAEDALQDACAQKGRRIMEHMSTANVARDLDRLREAVGDEQLSYLGFSYGTMVGATYANLFPDNVRAVALDSALDPIAWTTGYGDGDTVPLTARLGSHIGAQESLEEFFRLCDEAGPGSCPIAPDSEARFAAVVDALPAIFEFPIFDPDTGEVIGVDTFEYSARFLFADVVSILYSDGAWPIISFIVADLENLLFGPPPPPPFAAQFASDIKALQSGKANTFTTRAGVDFNRVPRYFNGLEGFPSVACSDSDNPDSIEAWFDAAEATQQESYFGYFWTFVGTICHEWPFADDDRYTGPWDNVTANPVLVVNNEFDPATPVQGAIAMDAALGNSQLLVVQGGRGHIAVQGSQCAADAISEYLLTQTLPPAGAVCFPDLPTPFLPPPPPPLLALIAPLDGVGDPIEVILIQGPPGAPPIAIDPETGEPINVDPETGEILPIEIIEILGPLEPPPPPPPGEEPPPPGEEPPPPGEEPQPVPTPTPVPPPPAP